MATLSANHQVTALVVHGCGPHHRLGNITDGSVVGNDEVVITTAYVFVTKGQNVKFGSYSDTVVATVML